MPTANYPAAERHHLCPV